jgi:hypothetical protein
MVCILVQILGYIGAAVIPNELVLLKLPVGLALLAAGVAGLVFVVLLSMQVYGTGLGILFGILTVFPCLGLIVLLVINSKATGILQQNGHKVGLMGASLAEF